MNSPRTRTTKRTWLASTTELFPAAPSSCASPTATSSAPAPSTTRTPSWTACSRASGATLPPEWALQVPADYVDVLKNAVPAALAEAGIDPAKVIGIAHRLHRLAPRCRCSPTARRCASCPSSPTARTPTSSSGSTTPRRPRPTASTSSPPSAASRGCRATAASSRASGSSPRACSCSRRTPRSTSAWITGSRPPTGSSGSSRGTYLRNACTAGYKGILPGRRVPERPSSSAHSTPTSPTSPIDKVAHEIGQLGERAGGLTAEAAAWTGLPEGIAVAVGNVDAHVTAPAAQATQPGQMVAIMGTSTCHVMNSDVLVEVPGMCGVVDGGIVSGLYGYEAGQSGVGDIFAWYVKNQVPARYFEQAEAAGKSVHQYLTDLAATAAGRRPRSRRARLAQRQPLGARRHRSSPASSSARPSPPRPRRSTARCSRRPRSAPARIVETFNASGVPVTEFIVAGGLLKNPFLMQTYSDILRMPISTIASEQGPALGSAIHAAVAAGAYADIRAAAPRWARLNRAVYTPDRGRRRRLRRALRRVHPAARLLRPRRQRRDAPPQDDPPGGARVNHVRPGDPGRDRAHPRGGRAPARGARALRARRLDRRQRLGPRARRRPVRHQAERRLLRRPRAREPDPVRPRRQRHPGHPGCERSPSSDTAAHAYVYRNMPEVGGVVHTHSTYATAWAARGERSRACSRRWPTSSAARSRSARSRSSATTRSADGIVETLTGHRSPRRADAEPRRLHDRQGRGDRRQGRRHGRGCRPHRAHRAPARRAAPHSAGSDRLALRPLPERLRPDHRKENSSDHVHRPRPRDQRGLVPHRQPEPLRRGDPAPGRRAVAGGRARARRVAATSR